MAVNACFWEGTMVGDKCSADDVLCFEEAGKCWYFVRGGDLGQRFDLILQYRVGVGVGDTHGEVGGVRH